MEVRLSKRQLPREIAALQESADRIAAAIRELRSVQATLRSAKKGVFSEPPSLMLERLEAAEQSAKHAQAPFRELLVGAMVMAMEELESQ
jgi:hypothetical protein